MAAGADEIAVVVLAYGSGGEHGPLLESLRSEGVAPESVLVVHNPAAPGEPPPAVPAGVEVVQMESNLGYAGAMNRGVERQLGRGATWLLVLTHDARLRPGALAALLAAANGEPGYGVLGPALVFSDSGAPFSFGGTTDANGSNAHVREAPRASSGIRACDWIDGGTLLLRGDMLALTGAFDERFWAYCEEADLCLRARRAGYGVGVVLDALADQAPGGANRPGAWSYLLTRNGLEYARRAAGARGAVTGVLRKTVLVASYLARTLLRATGLRPGDPRETWVLAIGTGRGTLDFLRRRWGPPPSDLPGLGDVSNA
ncbi:MAG TPA: glycosyltransferase [Thermoleophilaceae bacterium]|nr:glycosyltransferase [Thermoleophilaceae bacterium]